MIITPFVLHDDQWYWPKLTGLILGFGGVIILALPELPHISWGRAGALGSDRGWNHDHFRD
jgi:hypothetical protein